MNDDDDSTSTDTTVDNRHLLHQEVKRVTVSLLKKLMQEIGYLIIM